MICPKCGDEYRPGFTECADCRVPLVDALPDPDQATAPRDPGVPDPDLELVTVFETSDTVLLAIAKSLLQSADILFATTNEGLRDRFGYGVSVGPVGLQVGAYDADDARALLEGLADSEPDLDAFDDDDDDDDDVDDPGEPEDQELQP